MITYSKSLVEFKPDCPDNNPVLLQPQEHNTLAVYQMIFLEAGTLEHGDLINQDGTVLVKQGQILDEKTLQRIRLEFPGQKLIKPAEIEPEECTDA